MRKRILVAMLISSVASVLTSPTSASAEDTPVTLEVSGGTLGITVPTGPVNLGSTTVSSSPQTVSSQLGTVTVTDERGGTADWTATANAVDFTGPSTISVSAAGSSTYTAPAATVTGTATVTSHNLSPMYPAGPVQTAANVSGINTATWNPTIAIRVPANTLVGTYTSTITHSVS
ncbi:hypothetical protein [Streptomyces sp. NPDC002588]|uniref:hypothetical protein n=1 Tax=Streptomyces sp. NPDC002588 TaxID=3154419 RepID=UPI00331DAD03